MACTFVISPFLLSFYFGRQAYLSDLEVKESENEVNRSLWKTCVTVTLRLARSPPCWSGYPAVFTWLHLSRLTWTHSPGAQWDLVLDGVHSGDALEWIQCKTRMRQNREEYLQRNNNFSSPGGVCIRKGNHDTVERKDRQTNKQQWRLKHISERRDLTSHQIYNICTYCSGNWTAFLKCVSYRVCGPEACCYVVLGIQNPAQVLFLQRGHSHFCVNYDKEKKKKDSLV